MTLYEEIQKIDFEIKDLESKKYTLEKQLYKEINEKEESKLLSNYDKLLKLYNKGKVINDRIITCIPIRTLVCCGQGGSKYKRIRLSDLLKIWSNGYSYNGCPIYNITTTNSGYKSMTYIKDGKKETIYDIDIIKQYQNIPEEVLGREYKVD